MQSEIAESSEEAFRQLLGAPAARDFLLRLYCHACLGQLVPGAVHQLRNPLNAILNGTQLMQGQEDDEKLGTKLLPVMLRSSQRMGQILDAIDPVLDELAPCDLRLVVEQSLNLLRAHTMGVEIESEAGTALRVRGPMHALQAMVVSLLQTHLACRPTSMQLRLFSSGQWVELCIENVQAADLLDEAGLESMLQKSLAGSLGGTLTCSAASARSTLHLPLSSHE